MTSHSCAECAKIGQTSVVTTTWYKVSTRGDGYGVKAPEEALHRHQCSNGHEWTTRAEEMAAA